MKVIETYVVKDGGMMKRLYLTYGGSYFIDWYNVHNDFLGIIRITEDAATELLNQYA